MLAFFFTASLPCYGQVTSAERPASALSSAFEQSFQQRLALGRKLRASGDYVRAEREFRSASEEAGKAQAYSLQAQALLLSGGSEIHLHRYGSALTTLDSAKRLALRTHDITILGAVASNISSIYFALGDSYAAAATAQESVDYLQASGRKDYLANALVVNGNIQLGIGQVAKGKASLLKAIEVARSAQFPVIEAIAENELAGWEILNNDLTGAESLVNQAMTVGLHNKDAFGLAHASAHLAEIEQRRGGRELASALRHIDAALATTDERFKAEPQCYPLAIRAHILLSLGHKDQALAEFRRAVQSADVWRQSALPGDTTNLRTVVRLEAVYKDFAHLAAELSLERDDNALKREAFEVVARNRSASLREQQARSFRAKLLDSPEYFDVLQDLQTAQAAATLEKDGQKIEAQRQNLNNLRARLSDLENRIGLSQPNPVPSAEKKGLHTSLTGIQARLRPSEALLCFSLGERKSYLWTVTSEQVRLYDLPKQETIAAQAGNFSRAVSGSAADRIQAGRALSRSVFSSIPPSVQSKPNWLLTLDGALLDKVPFSALPATFENTNKPVIASHTLRILPSALLPQTHARLKATGLFVGVADPIYNLADARLDSTTKTAVRVRNVKTRAQMKVLGRLAASENEITSAGERCGLPQTRMLTGKEASGTLLRTTLRQPPEILHFAVHVISPDDFPQEAALALTLSKENLPELLTAESAATYRVPGSLVVLSGCASQQGEVLPGAGLVGLSRGWLLAGAAAVLVSAWPTPDSYKSFFPTFYTYYRQASGTVATRAAIALQKTQLELLRAGGSQSDPKIWAAYSILSKE